MLVRDSGYRLGLDLRDQAAQTGFGVEASSDQDVIHTKTKHLIDVGEGGGVSIGMAASKHDVLLAGDVREHQCPCSVDDVCGGPIGCLDHRNLYHNLFAAGTT